MNALAQRMLFRRPPSAEARDEISMQEVRALALIAFRGRTIMSAFADALGVPLSTATHTVDKLVAKGLVQRTRPDNDRRVVEVELSEAGKRHDQFFQEQRLAMVRHMLAVLNPQERNTFLELMAKIARWAKLPETRD